MKAFVFRITSTCNKHCPTCCCGITNDFLNPDVMQRKLSEIQAFTATHKIMPVICLTGGEPFLYRAKDKNGKKHNIVNLIALVRNIVPDALVIIKTSGWPSHRVLDSLLEQVELLASTMQIDVRLGFNLFQNLGAQAEERLYHMVVSVLKFQKTMRIETIYNKSNKSSTFKVIEKVLLSSTEGTLEHMVVNAELPYRFDIPTKCAIKLPQTSYLVDRLIRLDTMPAYPGPDKAASAEFFEARVDQICSNIRQGPDQILYNTDASFHHCNDAFADYSIPAFRSDLCESVESEFALLEEKFKQLKMNLDDQKRVFAYRREQCMYCTRFIHDLPHS